MPLGATIVAARGRRDPPSFPPLFSFDFFVSPTGGGAGHTGSINDPWSLTFAFSGAGGVIQPGHHIAIRGGTYDAGVATWSVSSAVSGSVGSGVDNIGLKVVFRNYNGESVKIINEGAGTIDTIDFACNYTWFWGLEFYDNGWTSRNVNLGGGTGLIGISNLSGNGVKFIHCITHDGQNNFGATTGAMESDNFEVYGCINYNAGVNPSPAGHDYYLHHTGASNVRIIIDSTINFNAFGLLGQFYANSDNVSWIDVLNSIWFGGGALNSLSPNGFVEILMGGAAQPPVNCRCLNNMAFQVDSGSSIIRIGQSAGNINTVEVGFNYCVGGGSSNQTFAVNRPVVPQSSFNVHDNFFKAADANAILGLTDTGALSYTWTTNEWHHVSTSGWNGASFASWKSTTGLGGSDTQSDAAPTITKVFVIPTTKYEPNRGHVCFFNWANLSNVPVDLSTILNPGNSYAIYDARDLVNPVLTGTYVGGTVNFPTTQKTDPTPIGGFVGGQTPTATAPFFNAFLVLRTG